MKRRIIGFAILSLALGIILTTLLSYNKTDIIHHGDCAQTYNQSLPSAVRRVDCSGHAYGFPFTFIESTPTLDLSYLDEPENSPLMLNVDAKANFDIGKLFLNIALWSVVSAVVLAALQYGIERRKDSSSSGSIGAEQ